MKRVAIWAAVSSLPQAKKISLEDQLAQGRAHAAMHNAVVVAELVVPGESRDIVLFEDACSRIRAYEQLKALIDARSIDVLIYLDRSRLGRTAALSMAVAELCNRANILLYELDSPPQSMEFARADHDDLLLGAIKSVGAQQEIRRFTDRHRKGMIGRANAGKFPARINYGYKAQYDASGLFDEYVIVEQAAAVVRLIISLYLDSGLGSPEIADRLNRAGHDAPDGGLWSSPSVVSILNHIKVYAGSLEYNKRSRTGRPQVTALGIWPAIIDVATVRRVQDERSRRAGAPKAIHSTYRYSLICYCATCGERMKAETATTARQTRAGMREYVSRRYRCKGGHTAIPERKVHRAMTMVIQRLQNDAYRAGLVEEQSGSGVDDLRAQLADYHQRIADLQDAINRADNDYYIRRRLDADRHDAIVASAKSGILAVQIEANRIEEQIADIEQVASYGDTLAMIARGAVAE